MDINEYLEKLDKFTKDPNLDVMEFVMKDFNLDTCKTKFLHVAGTNGKGSVCEMLSNVLVEAGYKVGKFISPHLIKFNDGIYINNKEISDEEVENILEPLTKKIEEYNNLNEVPAKWFEVITCVALIYFLQNDCDFVVLETGLGGLTDCTNVVKSMVSIITNIGFDHVDILGETIEKITTQKAGIIKENSDTVIVEQAEEITKIIEETCDLKNTKLHKVKIEDVKNYSYTEELQKFDYKDYKQIEINLKGKVQIYNASQVLEIIDVLKEKGYKISEEAIRKGLKEVVHKARMEKICDKPLMVFDGAHNENAIDNFKQNIEQYYKEYKKIYIISVLKTKDYKTVIKKLCEDKESIFIFTDGNDKKKYVAKEKLYNAAYDITTFSKLFTMSLTEALNVVTKLYEDRLILVVGSFYVYKDVKEYLENQEGI